MKKRQLSDETSKKIADEALRQRELLSKIVAEEEYELREESLGKPLKDGLYSGSFYIMGAAFPLIPYFFGLPIIISFSISLGVASAILAIVGFIIAISASLNIKRKIIELIIQGLVSGMAIFLIGRLASTLIP